MSIDYKWIGSEVRVKFELEVEYGFPPITTEYLIGVLKSKDTVRIDNTPFFVEGIALGDVVECTGSPPNMTFESLKSESGYKAISIIFIDRSCEEEIFQSFKIRGCYVEVGEFPDYDMMAVAIPANLDYGCIKDELQILESRNMISFSELVS